MARKRPPEADPSVEPTEIKKKKLDIYPRCPVVGFSDEVLINIIASSTKQDTDLFQYLLVNQQFRKCARKVYKMRKFGEPFEIEIGNRYETHIPTQIEWYKKYIDAFGPVITHVKLEGRGNILRGHWILSLLDQFSNIETLTIQNILHNTDLNAFLSKLATSLKNLNISYTNTSSKSIEGTDIRRKLYLQYRN